jgi:hypothetical protein
MARLVLVSTLVVLGWLPAVRAQDAAQSRFVGTWVGTQKWAIENPPPSAYTPQAVTLTIEIVDGKLVGVMSPFFGGADGARFVDSRIEGEQLQASAIVGDPAQRRTGWKANTTIQFAFQNDGTRLVGTADVRLGDVTWTKFSYDLSRKRSRY